MMAVTGSPSKQSGTFEDSGTHIVIAESNAITRRMIELAIIGLDWTFDSAADGLEALSVVERAAPNLALILAGMDLPKMTGSELTKALKSQPSLAQVPVVLLGRPEQESEARAAGCDGFLAKPFCTADLLDALNL